MKKYCQLACMVAGLFSASIAAAFAPCHEREITESTEINLLGPPDENSFYYRAEIPGNDWTPDTFVVYIAPSRLIRHVSDTSGVNPGPWADLLPLDGPTDLFQPILEEDRPRQRRAMRRVLAQAIAYGDAAVWTTSDGFLETLVVERFSEGCLGGRVYKDARGNVLFQIVDSIA